MCKKAILPTVMESDLLGSDIVNLMYVFNRWLNVLISYGKLDSSNLTYNFNTISKVLKNPDHGKTVRQAIMCCRDYALVESMNPKVLIRRLRVQRMIYKSSEKW